MNRAQSSGIPGSHSEHERRLVGIDESPEFQLVGSSSHSLAAKGIGLNLKDPYFKHLWQYLLLLFPLMAIGE